MGDSHMQTTPETNYLDISVSGWFTESLERGTFVHLLFFLKKNKLYCKACIVFLSLHLKISHNKTKQIQNLHNFPNELMGS